MKEAGLHLESGIGASRGRSPFTARTRLRGLIGWTLVAQITMGVVLALVFDEIPEAPAFDCALLAFGFCAPALVWIHRQLAGTGLRLADYVGPFPPRRAFGLWSALLVSLIGLALADTALGGELARARDEDSFRFWYVEAASPAEPYGMPARWLVLLPWAFVLVVAAPLVEELVFRGVLIDVLEPRRGRAFAWGVSATIFGLLHPPQVLNAILFGLVLTALRVTSGGLALPIALHAANNLLPALLAGQELVRHGQISAFDGTLPGGVGAGLLLLVLCLPLPLRVLARGWRAARAAADTGPDAEPASRPT